MLEKIESLIERGKFDSALSLSKKALKERHEEKEQIYKYIVWIYRMKGRPKTALKYLEKLTSSAEKICEEAILLRMMNKFKSAQRKAKKALKIFKSKNEQEGICFCLWLLGGIGRYGGNPKKGYENFSKG